MTKVTPERDMTRSARNYFAHGGGELVIGGKLTFLPGATVEGGDGLFVGNAKGFVRLNLAMPQAIIAEGLRRICAAVDRHNALQN